MIEIDSQTRPPLVISPDSGSNASDDLQEALSQVGDTLGAYLDEH